MPYCVQCGSEVKPKDVFCAQCGTRQNVPVAGPAAGEDAGTPPGSASGASKSSAFAAPPPISFKDDLRGLNPRTASVLCYAPGFGWIMAIVVLASQRFRADGKTRFHAFQGLYLFAVYFLVNAFLPEMFDFARGTRFVAKAVEVSLLGISVMMMVKTWHGESFRLPVLGDLAEKSVSEQR